MRTLNLGVLAHVDAGKTSLTERLLHTAGVIDELGSVDDGNTQTDSLALERRRGITIRSAVVAFTIADVAVNLIDTPGHPDFIAEVERVLSVLDGAVLVVSAVEGVQPQTRILMRALQRLHVPTLIFVNKTDLVLARPEAALRSIAARLTPAVAPVDDARRVAELLADQDDALLAAYVDDEICPVRLRAALADQTRRARVHPVFFGSARTGAGVDALIAGLVELLGATERPASGPPAGDVFKIERDEGGAKIAYVRMRAGTLRTRDRVAHGKVTAIDVFEDGATVRRPAVAAGRIAKVRGLDGVRIGDSIGAADPGREHRFAPPTLETVVLARTPGDRRGLRVALEQLAEQDPLIDLRQDRLREEIAVSLYGEVQKEVIQATLADDFGVDVEFRESTTICIERPVGSGAAERHLGAGGNPFVATVGLRVDPAPRGAGVSFGLEVEPGALPASYFSAVEESVRETLGGGGLCGWRVTDCHVAMTHSGYAAKNGPRGAFVKSTTSTAGDFRGLTALVLRTALERAGTTVYEPLHRFHLELPADTLGAALPVLGRLGALPDPPELAGETCTIEGDIRAARVHELRRRLPALTRGEGVLESAFDRYEPARRPAPRR